MKIDCPCGAIIVDQTDYLNYKASLVSDQDVFDLLELLKNKQNNPWDTFRQHEAATLYQCRVCHRLLIFRGQELSVFLPDHARNILYSAKGEEWKRPLLGHWADATQEGSLYWSGTGNKNSDSGFFKFQTWAELETAYHVVFERLKAAGQLRTARLSRNGNAIHVWPIENHANESKS